MNSSSGKEGEGVFFIGTFMMFGFGAKESGPEKRVGEGWKADQCGCVADIPLTVLTSVRGCQ